MIIFNALEFCQFVAKNNNTHVSYYKLISMINSAVTAANPASLTYLACKSAVEAILASEYKFPSEFVNLNMLVPRSPKVGASSKLQIVPRCLFTAVGTFHSAKPYQCDIVSLAHSISWSAKFSWANELRRSVTGAVTLGDVT